MMGASARRLGLPAFLGAINLLVFCTLPVVSFSLLPSRTSAVKASHQPPVLFSSLSSDDATSETKWSMVESIQVQTLEKQTVSLGDVVDCSENTVILSCLSHFGDFNAWELTQQYIAAIESGRITSDSPVVLVGIGSVESAQQFARDLELDKHAGALTLLADESGSVTEGLGCYQGWLAVDQEHRERYPDSDVNPYIKLLGMIFGFGSPGTIPRVLYGYFGDMSNDEGITGRKWVVDSLLQGSARGRWPPIKEEAFDGVPEDASLRPFELATLRLQTGLHIVSKFSSLGTKNGDLLTRMGGTFVFSHGECVYSYFDQGILVYANIEDICNVANAALRGERYVPAAEPRALKAERKQLREKIEA